MKDPTFTNYSADQALLYSQHRTAYPNALVKHIIDHHTKTGGQLHSLLDLGCGPGTATRDFAKFFSTAHGLDPSEEMIRTAQRLGGETATGEAITYLQSEAEKCDAIKTLPPHSVDLITAGMSAHWFDMQRFWPAAANVLRPGGTVAFFNVYRMYCHPYKTPRAAEVQALLWDLEHVQLKPHHLQPNILVMDGYRDIELPWSLSPNTTRSAFSPNAFVRKQWNENGRPDPEIEGGYFAGEEVRTLDEAQKAIETTSAVTRWREANPSLAGTEEDCVVKTFRGIRQVLGPRVEVVGMVGRVTLLMVKRLV